MSWTIVKADPDTPHRGERAKLLDGLPTTSSFEPPRREGIDVCSASRHGRSDLGVNAARIRTYLAALHDAEKPDN